MQGRLLVPNDGQSPSTVSHADRHLRRRFDGNLGCGMVRILASGAMANRAGNCLPKDRPMLFDDRRKHIVLENSLADDLVARVGT
jgi:hypothetical protein